MPFDSVPGHANEKLLELRDLLRAKMPRAFLWDFPIIFRKRNRCGTQGCAIGLAHLRWPDAISTSVPPGSKGGWFRQHQIIAQNQRQWQAFFGLDARIFDAIFMGTGYIYGVDDDDVKPATVADAIDHYHLHGNLEGFTGR